MQTEKRIPTITDSFPAISVRTTLGEINLPQYFQGKWFVLFSHPGDFTPVCTTEFVAFEQLKGEFEKLNCELIGLSVEQVFSHLKWIEWIREQLGVEITFPIIADSLGKVAGMLGMIHPDRGTRTVRVVFIVDDQGLIRLTLHYPEEVGRNIFEILRAVHALQTASYYKVATPANWPKNSLIGNQVIVPPANSVKKIQERYEEQEKGEVKCFDWWLCYKQSPK